MVPTPSEAPSGRGRDGGRAATSSPSPAPGSPGLASQPLGSLFTAPLSRNGGGGGEIRGLAVPAAILAGGAQTNSGGKHKFAGTAPSWGQPTALMVLPLSIPCPKCVARHSGHSVRASRSSGRPPTSTTPSQPPPSPTPPSTTPRSTPSLPHPGRPRSTRPGSRRRSSRRAWPSRSSACCPRRSAPAA
jgi:hypothetical protein